MIIYHNSKN